MSASMLMATRSSDGSEQTITCPSCDVTVRQAAGSRRTICPNCGNFYRKEDAERPEPRRLAARRKAQEKRKSGGQLQKIANFFQNLTPNNNGEQNDPNAFSSVVIRNGSDSSSDISGRSTELPPITQGHLTAHGGTGSRSTTPSYVQDGPSMSRNLNVLSKVSNSRTNVNGSSEYNSIQGSGTSKAPVQGKKVIYPVRTKTSSQIREDVRTARENGNWRGVQDFYSTTFDSFLEINAAFKRDPYKDYKTVDDPGLKFDFINTVFDLLLGLPQDIQKNVLKSIINSLLKDKKPHSKDDLRAYLVLLQNPQFGSSSTYVIFAHLLRQIAALTDHDHHYMVYWIRKIAADRFRTILERLHSFISVRLFPPKPQDLPHMEKCTWWIPSATKVMALLNAANNLSLPLLVPYVEFYNSTLDNLDLMVEYFTWQDPSSSGGFSFCQYPFILSIAAKRSILQKDSEHQMIIMARRSLVAKVQRRQLPDVGMLFLNLNVRRENLVSDSLNEIARKQHDLKKKLKVTFAGEPGLDMGGLTKEWFLLLIRQIFQQDYGMFTYDKRAGVYWFRSNPCENYQEFNLVGVLMGLAVYNSTILDIRFPPICYKKLLSPAVVPYNNPRATVGITSVTLQDLKQIQPEVAKGLQDLLEYDGDVEDDFGLTFQVSTSHFGSVKSHDLKPDGANIPVTKENRKEYVNLYVDWLLNKSIYPHFQAFYHGFHTVCASNALIMLRPEEIEMLVCGNPRLDMSELKKVTVYDGYTSQDPTIKYFWDVVLNIPHDLQKRMLLFATGSDRIPIGGMAEMQFKISRAEGTDLLPMAHTCFNQLILPPYRSKKILRQKIILAIQNAEGFGIE